MTPPPPPKRRKLSDKLKNMRFMKRREEADLRVKLLEDQTKREHEDHWVVDKPVSEQSKNMPLVIFEEAEGDDPFLGRRNRRSYGGFNPIFEGEPLKPLATVRSTSQQQNFERHAHTVAKVEPQTTPNPSHPHSNYVSVGKVDLSVASTYIAKRQPASRGVRRRRNSSDLPRRRA